MARTSTAETLDTRIALRVYAALLGLGGVSTAIWGPTWLGADMPVLPSGKAALVRVGGAVLVYVAVSAASLSFLERQARTRMLAWFVPSHLLVWLLILAQLEGKRGETLLVMSLTWAMLVTMLAFLHIRFPSGVITPGGPVSIFDAPPRPDAHVPSYHAYEQQIRHAAAQEERNRLARDLHDAVKQQIFAIQTSAAAAEARLETDAAGARSALAQVRQSAREAMAEMEALLDQLRVAPIGITGLVEAIRKHCEALTFRTGAVVDLDVAELPSEGELRPGAPQAIYRIVQEALANVGRHARARHVQVSLGTSARGLEVSVKDDGQGFDHGQPGGGTGLQNMYARAGELGGSLVVHAADGAGTVVTLLVPFAAPDSQQTQSGAALASFSSVSR